MTATNPGQKMFAVVGFPRSRTTWMAAFLSAVPGVACLHEPLSELREDWRELGERLRATGARHAGIADTGAALFRDRVLDIIGRDAPALVIRRDPNAVHASLLGIGFPGIDRSAAVRISRGLDSWAALPGAMEVGFGEIDARLPEIVAHLTRGETEAPAEVAGLFRKINIQPTRETCAGYAGKLAGNGPIRKELGLWHG